MRPAFVIAAIAALLALAFVARREGWADPPAPIAVAFAGIHLDADIPPVRTTGCGAAWSALGRSRQSIDIDKTPRTYELVVPKTYDSARPYRLVLAFHGSGWNGSAFIGQLGFESETGDDAILVYPDAVVRHIWGTESATHWGRVDDLPFVDALVARLKSTLCIDERRIFAVGWSSGGYFANQLGCVRPNLVRAIVSLSGGGPEQATCTEPVPTFLHHAQDDRSVYVSEGRKSRDSWYATNGCKAELAIASGCTTFSCKQPLVYCETNHTGHSMPPSVRAAAWTFLRGF